MDAKEERLLVLDLVELLYYLGNIRQGRHQGYWNEANQQAKLVIEFQVQPLMSNQGHIALMPMKLQSQHLGLPSQGRTWIWNLAVVIVAG